VKRSLFLMVLALIIAIPSFGQTGPYLVDYFSNNPGPTKYLTEIPVATVADQQIRLVNFGAAGTPLTSPDGDVCANIYVFDANQEMISCCSCRITPNGLLTLSIGNNLTGNPVTSVVPVNGDVKIVSTAAIGLTGCTPLTYNGGILDSVAGFGTHLQTSGGAIPCTYISETNIPSAALGAAELVFLPQACQFARYLGSGKGVCNCNDLN